MFTYDRNGKLCDPAGMVDGPRESGYGKVAFSIPQV